MGNGQWGEIKLKTKLGQKRKENVPTSGAVGLSRLELARWDFGLGMG